jgi:hypothetical protein
LVLGLAHDFIYFFSNFKIFILWTFELTSAKKYRKIGIETRKLGNRETGEPILVSVGKKPKTRNPSSGPCFWHPVPGAYIHILIYFII